MADLPLPVPLPLPLPEIGQGKGRVKIGNNLATPSPYIKKNSSSADLC
jgi:hypothetical protein